MWLCYTSFWCAFLALSLFFFFLLMTLLAIYFLFILDYGNNIRQKANSSDFFDSHSIWVIKLQRQLTTSTTHLAQELTTNVQCSGSPRNFAKEKRALTLRSAVAGRRKLTATNWEQSSKLILLQLHKKLLRNSMSTLLCSLCIWSKLERWKNLKSECLKSWPKI